MPLHGYLILLKIVMLYTVAYPEGGGGAPGAGAPPLAISANIIKNYTFVLLIISHRAYSIMSILKHFQTPKVVPPSAATSLAVSSDDVSSANIGKITICYLIFIPHTCTCRCD